MPAREGEQEEAAGWELYPNGEAEVVFKLPDGTTKTVRFQRNPIGMTWKKGVIGSSHVYVGSVAEESHAKMFGIQEGWRIMRVNGNEAATLSRQKLNYYLYERTKELPEAPFELSLLLAPGQAMPDWGPAPSKENGAERSQSNGVNNINGKGKGEAATEGGGDYSAVADHVERNFVAPLPLTSLQATLSELRAKKRLMAGDDDEEDGDDALPENNNMDSLDGLRTVLYELKSNGRSNIPLESGSMPSGSRDAREVPILTDRREQVPADPAPVAPLQPAPATTEVTNGGPGDEMWGTSGAEIARALVGEAVTSEAKASEQTILSDSSGSRAARAKAKVRQPQGLASFYQRASWLRGGGCQCTLDELFTGCNPRAEKEATER